MKKTALCLAILFCLTILTACGKTEKVYTAEDVAGQIYTYEKDGFGGPFTISIFEDGSFQYYVGLLSSYIGLGEWTVEDGILTLKDNTGLDYVNLFRIGEDMLIFLEEGSTGTMYLDMEDGDRFFGEPLKDYLSNINFSSYFGGSGHSKYLVSLDEVRTLMLYNSDSKVDRVKELLEGFTHEDLKQRWGEPDSMTSGIWSFAWNLDETSTIWVIFDGDGYVSEVRLHLKD